MSQIFNTLFNIMLLRAGPQDLPGSRRLTMGFCIAYLATGVLTAQQLGGDDGAARSGMSILLQFVVITALLRMRHHAARIEQTLLAIAGTGILIGVLAFMLLLQADPGVQQPLMALAWFGIFGWSLAIDASIYRHALSITMSQGVLVAVLLLAGSYVAGALLFDTSTT